MLPIPEQYLKSKCEIKSLEDKVISTGVLSKLAEDDIQICRDSDFLPTLQRETLVKIYVSHPTLELKTLIGKVYISSSDLLQITNIQNLTDFERRNFFRLKLNIHTQASQIQEDGLSNPIIPLFQINVIDLSLSGFFVKTKRTLKIGDRFITSLPLSDSRISFVCKVERSQKSNGKSNGYGCAFVDNSNRQYDELCKYIFEKQREQIRNSRRNLF